MRNFFALLITGVISLNAEAQQITSSVKTLVWSDTMRKIEFSDYRLHDAFYFSGASYNETLFDYLPLYSENVRLPFDGTVAVTVTDASYTPVANPRMRSANFSDSKIQNTPAIVTGRGYDRGKPVAQITILPFRKNPVTNALERLTSFRYNISITPSSSSSIREGEYAANSVLATGTWFKIGVTRDGIYKMDKSFLTNLGIDVASIDPHNIRVYGNGGNMIPESNAIFRYDDLQENAISVIGEGDGRFDDGDYVLFYGQGPDRWELDTLSGEFLHTRHAYSDTIAYFITIDKGAGKRIADISSASSPNKFISTFHDYAVHEVDQENFIKSGRTFYGEAFEFETNQSFPFSFPSLVTSAPIKVNGYFLGKSIYTSNTIEASYAGQVFASVSIAKICADYTCPFGNEVKFEGQFNATSSAFNVDLEFKRFAQDAQGWLNFLEVNAERALTWIGSQNNFRNITTTGKGSISQYSISNANSSLLVWNVSNPLIPVNQITTLNGTTLEFASATDTLQEFVVSANSEGYNPSIIGPVVNQDLHGLSAHDMIIISPEILLPSAQQYADYHVEHDGISSVVISLNQAYNEFSSGTPDVGAIRDLVRMFYKRAGSDSTLMPKYLLLFGDGSFDNKGIDPAEKSLVPTYQSLNSLNPTSSYVSDDFFGFLDDDEGDNMLDSYAYIDVAIGRLPVNTTEQADAILNKIKIYTSSASFGNWRNMLTFLADDEDNNVHINDSEEIAGHVASLHPVYNIDKIYLDAYQQTSVPGGHRYPDVNTAINNRIASGTLMINYIGHGGEGGWGHERIYGISDIQGHTNICKLPLFVTATCEFSKYDDPGIISAGEELLLNAEGGAIALVTTVRLVYSSANAEMNDEFMYYVFAADPNGIIPSLGEVFRRSKNATAGQGTNNRKFTLIGDPAMTLAYPHFNVQTTSVNGHVVGSVPDTLKALQKVTIAGTVNDLEGNVMTDFNGTLYPTVFDKAVTYQTLKNDGTSYVKSFSLQKNVIYNGKASVKNGLFTFSFIVPKDISYQYGNGKLSYYANDLAIDAQGYKSDIVIGGITDSAAIDVAGPAVKVYMNDDKFVTGGMTDGSPTVLVKISDSSGVNTVGTGIGHDITGVLDNNSQNTLVMNDFYSADLDSYSSGEVRYPLTDLEEGLHIINVKAWDVYNNSAEGFTEFIVSSSASMALDHVFNYPNPFTTRTEFMFEHNMPGQMLDVLIQVYTVSGKLIKTIQQTVMPEALSSTGNCCGTAAGAGGYRVNGIYWDGRDDYGDLIGKGVYVYKLTVRTDGGMSADTYEKLVLLK